MVRLNIITNIPPLDLHIEGEVLKARVQLTGKLAYNWLGKYFGKTKGHILHADDEYKEAKLTSCDKLDDIPHEIIWVKKFKIDHDSFQTGDDVRLGPKCYTDGSKLNGRVGAGVYIQHDYDSILSKHVALGEHNTVFQAEIRAFILAVKTIEEVILQHGNPGYIVILSDWVRVTMTNAARHSLRRKTLSPLHHH